MAPALLALPVKMADILTAATSNLAPPYLLIKPLDYRVSDPVDHSFLWTSHDNVDCPSLKLVYGGLHPPFTIRISNPYATSQAVNASVSFSAELGPFENSGDVDWKVISPPDLWLQATLIDAVGSETAIPPIWVREGTLSKRLCWNASLITGNWIGEILIYFPFVGLALIGIILAGEWVQQRMRELALQGRFGARKQMEEQGRRAEEEAEEVRWREREGSREPA